MSSMDEHGILQLTLRLKPEHRDDPGLGRELALAKHNREPVTLVVHGFDYQLDLQLVQLERVKIETVDLLGAVEEEPLTVKHIDGSVCEYRLEEYRVLIKARGDSVPDVGDLCPFHQRVQPDTEWQARPPIQPLLRPISTGAQPGPISGKNFPVFQVFDARCKEAGRHLPTERHDRRDCSVGER